MGAERIGFTVLASLCLAFSLSKLGHVTVSFGSAATYPTGRTPVAVAVGDFNGDGRVDLALATYGNPGLTDDGGGEHPAWQRRWHVSVSSE